MTANGRYCAVAYLLGGLTACFHHHHARPTVVDARTAMGHRLFGQPVVPACSAFQTSGHRTRRRLGILLGSRGCEAVSLFVSLGLPCINAQPFFDPSRPHMYSLPCWVQLLQLAGVDMQHLAQCMLGADYTKMSSLVHFGVDLSDAPTKCQHSDQRWKLIPSGQVVVRPHPPLQGKIRAVPESEWIDDMWYRQPEADAPFLTRATASYPSAFNRYLATKLIHGIVNWWRASRSVAVAPLAAPPSEIPIVNMDRGNINFRTPLSLTNASEAPPKCPALGGMRSPIEACVALPSIGHAGRAVRASVVPLLRDQPDLLNRCLSAIGSEDPQAGPTAAQCAGGRQVIWEALRSTDANSCEGLWSTDEANPDLPTPPQYTLLEAWRRVAGDPEVHVHDWCRHGAPAGIAVEIPTCGVFPLAEPDPELIEPHEVPACDSPEEFVNYTGIDDDPDAAEAIFKLRDASPAQVRECRNWQTVIDLVGCVPVVSKVGIVKRIIAGKVKKRVIVDSK